MTRTSVLHLPLLSLAASFVGILFLLSITKTGAADELRLGISLGLSAEQAADRYKPLVNFLEKETRQRIQLYALPNALAHWEMMRRDGFDLVLDNPAFTGYRASKMHYTVICKMPDVLSFTLVTHVNDMMIDPNELIGRRVASLPSPSISALRLNEIFANPMRQPLFIKVNTHAEALELVIKGLAQGAMVPTGMVANHQNLNPIYISSQIPAPGFSVGPSVSPELRDNIRQALLNAHKSAAGQDMLNTLNVTHFEAATNATYSGMESMLKGLYGY